jgi:hypothetical protein
VWFHVLSQAQCDKSLVLKATEQVGKDVVLVRNFKVKLKEGDKRNPSPSSRYTVLMQKDISYRFNILGATENTEIPVLQLYDKSNLLGSTFDVSQNKNLNDFIYQCSRTGDYQVIVNFRNGKAGCAAGVMAMVIDSAFLASRNEAEQTEEPKENVLYLGVPNHLEVSTDSLGDDKLELTIDHGIIKYKRGNYTVLVDSVTRAKITAKRISRDNKVVEETVKEYKVIPLPKPKVRLEKVKSDYVSSLEIPNIYRLEVIPSVYKIVEFYISSSNISYSGFKSDNEYLTYDQQDFLKNLYSHNRFYIHDIRVEAPDGSIINVKSLEYFVQ